jgi:hypothetical protein
VDRCEALTRFREPARVLGNLRDRTFEEQVKKYTAIWNAPPPAVGVVAAIGSSVVLPGTNGPGTVVSLPRDPAAPGSALQSAPESVTSPPHARPTAPSQEPQLLRDPTAAVAPPAGLGSATSPPQEPPPLPGNGTPGPAAAEPASQSGAVTPPAPPGSVTPLPPRRPVQTRIATPPRAAAPP